MHVIIFPSDSVSSRCLVPSGGVGGFDSDMRLKRTTRLFEGGSQVSGR
jgi:hypothetical protein